jgi:hypothetical protein
LGFHPCILLIWVVSMLDTKGKITITIIQMEEEQPYINYTRQISEYIDKIANKFKIGEYTLPET